MTFPAARFTAVAPPPDGLALAFSSARRRRNSKAAVSAFGGAVAIASVLSFLAPPGQNLVQEPAQPAHGGLLPGLPDAPRHSGPAPQVGQATEPLVAPAAVAAATTTQPISVVRRAAARPTTAVPPGPCQRKRTLACIAVGPPTPGGPRMQAVLCPSSASVTVEYDAPQVGPTRISVSRTVAVGSCSG
ncbi:MAG: hypothetical protein QOJ79_459 [Actinomycetota bacterium]|jgi:hypothetical protein|nr:hypothetical protein [Actinomycetota bacterium]